MEMNAREPRTPQPKTDGLAVNCDGLASRNGEPAEITVSLSHPGKRVSPIEGSNLYRLRDRKFLLEDKRRLCAWALGAAMLGILLMIAHAELCPAVYQPGSIYALSINGLISVSTGCLLFLIIAFHYKDVRNIIEIAACLDNVHIPVPQQYWLFSSLMTRVTLIHLPSSPLSLSKLFIIDHNQVDWRIAMTTNRVLGISLELLVCAIHPVASYLGPDVGVPTPALMWNSSVPPICLCQSQRDTWMEVELLLSGLMFLRLYLVHRAILLHSKVLLSASYRSIGSLNNINFTFRFVLKVLMNKYPARTLLVFIMFFWLSAAWMLRLCERQEEVKTRDMGTALWLIAITFLTVGYGDVSPETSCGKVVCLFTGVMGVACTAMLVAVVTKKLALNKGEKHVHFFMMDIQISKEIRNAAANVLRECWLLHRTTQAKNNNGEHRHHQRCLLEAIRV
ncbi:hypothetical protein NFI96_022657 [Prochilodus magdalenae]|nr:hypothetical protein NFI96_022657 [Prochilodus magdalenae]